MSKIGAWLLCFLRQRFEQDEIKRLLQLEVRGTIMRRITIYRDDSTTQVVYENVKHIFWTAGNTVLVIAQYTDVTAGAHRYIQWPRERICWFKDEKQQEVKEKT